MGFFADPHFRCLRKPEISAFEVECLPGRADGLEKSAVDPGLRAADVGHTIGLDGCGALTSRSAPCELAKHTVSELCHVAPETPVKHRRLRGHADAYQCCGKSLIGSELVGFRVRQHARAESISKRAPSTARTSLRLARLRGFEGWGEAKLLIHREVTPKGWHYTGVTEATWAAVIFGGGCGGSANFSRSNSSFSSGSGCV